MFYHGCGQIKANCELFFSLLVKEHVKVAPCSFAVHITMRLIG